MSVLGIVLCVFMVSWIVVSIANIPLAIWQTKLETKKQSENNACIYALYKELERYNNSTININTNIKKD